MSGIEILESDRTFIQRAKEEVTSQATRLLEQGIGSLVIKKLNCAVYFILPAVLKINFDGRKEYCYILKARASLTAVSTLKYFVGCVKIFGGEQTSTSLNKLLVIN